jgi:hypothetical protein
VPIDCFALYAPRLYKTKGGTYLTTSNSISSAGPPLHQRSVYRLVGTEGRRHFIDLPQSFIGIVWHQQLVAAVVTVGVVAAGVGAGADAVRVSTNHKFRMVIMVVDLL